MKGFKKLYALVALLVAAIISISSLSYAMFVYNDKNAELEGTHTTSNLVNFSSVASSYYRIYFFASPLYATGANIDDDQTDDQINTISDTDEQDPKIIADSVNNPYNDTTTDYWTINGSHSGDSTKSNFNIDGSNYTWIPSENISQESAGSATITPYKKADFTGYIRENTSNEANLSIKKTSTYFSLVVEGQITASQLSAIVATSEYKDSWGFGPEFIGWTYDKAGAASRIKYSSTQRAEPDTNSYTYDSTTSTITYKGENSGSGSKYLYGNYGRSSDIDIISDSTSLQYIDNYSSNGSSIDGSSIGDNIIYLYPVFGAKQTSGLDSYHNLIKFRRNPGDSPQTYQSDEIDYTKNRLTRYFIYSSNNNTPANYNYYINDYYLSSSDTNRIDMSINSTSSLETEKAGYGSDWPSLITSDEIKSLNLDTGYYDIRLSIWYESGTSTNIETVSDVFKTFYETNYYDAIMYSHSSSGNSSSSVTLSDGTSVSCPNIYSQKIGTGSGSNNSANFYYVIGFHKVSDLHLTGDNLNDNISSYSNEGYRKLAISNHRYSDNITKFFFVEDVELYENEKFTVLDKELEEGKDYTSINYTTSALADDYISDYNSFLTGSSNDNTKSYNSINTTNCPISITNTDSNKSFTCSKDGVYSFLFTITYSSKSSNEPVKVNSVGIGIPSGNVIKTINIAYKEISKKYKFIVLSDPSKRSSEASTCNHSVGFEYVYDEKAHWARCKNCGALWTSEMNESTGKVCSHLGDEDHTMVDNECTVCGYIKGESSYLGGAFFNSYSSCYNFDSYVCSGEYDKDTIINASTVLTTKNSGDTLINILNNHWGKELVDISTGLVFNYRVFLSNEFKLNRNYVLYIRNGSSDSISSSKINTDCDINFNNLTEKTPDNFHYSTDSTNGIFISGNVTEKSITYNGTTYDKGVKLENSSGEVKFDLAKKMTVTLLFSASSSSTNGTVKIDGVEYELTYDSTNTNIATLTIELEAGEHTITKGSNTGQTNIYLLSFTSTSNTSSDTSNTSA